MLASHALALVGVPMRRVIRTVQDQRDARYNLLRGYFHGVDDDTVDEMNHERLTTFTLPLAAKTLGQALGDLALHAIGVRVVSLRRTGGAQVPPDDACVLQDGDTLVLSGKAQALAVGQQKLLQG
jgi:monovalent cation:H+ antiporter-2, CPA2 family